MSAEPCRTPLDRDVISLVVTRRVERAEDVVELTLSALDAHVELPSWAPGAHIDLLFEAPGLGSVVRQYSICGDPGDHLEWRVAVLGQISGRGGSKYLRDHVEEGSTVLARGPRNHFPLIGAGDYLFIAGGIGITPILPMLSALEEGVNWRLYYGGRKRSSMAYVEQLTQEFGQRVCIIPEDECGLPDLDQILGQADFETAVYCCGPSPMLDAVEAKCTELGLSAPRMERFAARVGQADPADRRSFDVEFRRLGVTRTVSADESILDVAEALGSEVFGSCREGICGTCETRVLEGVPDHRDSILDEERRSDRMMICVSRALSPRLILDA